MVVATSTHQLLLLADHLKLSLLERQRAIALNIESDKQDGHISRSLTTLQEGLEQLDAQYTDVDQAGDDSSDLARLRRQFTDLYAQFHGTQPMSAELQKPNDPSLKNDFAAAQSMPHEARKSKSVRFRDNPNEEDPAHQANRAALFAEQGQYRDEPEVPDQSNLDNQQIHTYHKQVLQEQDEQLDVLGQSIGRQRMLGIQMGSELDEQNELLHDVEGGVDRHSDTLGRAQKRLGTIARKGRDNWNWITIAILIIILVLLLVIFK